MAHRPVTDQIPEYLQPYIVQQDPSLYTPIDHASWRFILKIARAFFAKHAHQKYLDGLRETGISTERIPLISEMDACLRKFGWRAVAVSGFIPPAVFMEFQARGILPIACDMRKIENLAYTPAPDIVHEAAGHAPILADPEFAEYLRHYGELAEKAIFSSQDLAVYEAVRNLSEVKEDPNATPEQIAAAQRRLDESAAAVDHVSEATQLGRMGWWTFEYGLIGTEKDPKIYGAGLLSSVGESYHCLKPEVKKVPFTVDCVNVEFDITKPQPQLFLAPDFQTLTQGLDQLAERMAFRQGGTVGLDKAIRAATTTTAMLESGIQISGTLARYETDTQGNVIYLKYDGPSQLSYQGQELEGQGASYHREGFSTVLGGIQGLGKSPAELTTSDLERAGFVAQRTGRLEFDSGITLEGQLKSRTERDGKNLILTFENCSVKLGGRVLFDPSWGTYDLACGSRVVSVFGWAADRQRYLAATGGFGQAPGRPKTNLTPANRDLNALYARVRRIREEPAATGALPAVGAQELSTVHEELEKNHREDWLLRYELLELDQKHRLNSAWASSARKRLDEIARSNREKAELIGRGMELL